MDKLVTREGIKVEIGQVWRDLDPRMNNRTVVVEGVDEANGAATVRSSAGRKSVLSVKRMHRHATGYQLVERQ